MDRWTCPPPEEIDIKNEYSFTFSPQEQPVLEACNKKDAFGTNLCAWDKDMVNFFRRLKYCRLRIYMEVSKNGRLHYHGYIKIINIPYFFTVDIRRLQAKGTYEIDILNDPTKWSEYISKQKSFMQIFCEKECITYSIEDK